MLFQTALIELLTLIPRIIKCNSCWLNNKISTTEEGALGDGSDFSLRPLRTIRTNNHLLVKDDQLIGLQGNIQVGLPRLGPLFAIAHLN
jgi:hypothetical protein